MSTKLGRMLTNLEGLLFIISCAYGSMWRAVIIDYIFIFYILRESEAVNRKTEKQIHS